MVCLTCELDVFITVQEREDTLSDDYDFNTVEDRMYIYPIIDALSEGQRAMISYAEFKDMIVSGSLDEESWKKVYDEVKEKTKSVKPNSVYAGILRSAFQPGGVALTNEARNMQAATGTSFDDGLFGMGIDYKPMVGFGTSLLLLVGGTVTKNIGLCAIQTSMRAGDRIEYLENRIEFVNDELFGYAEAMRREYKIVVTNMEWGIEKVYDGHIANLYNVYKDINPKYKNLIEEYMKDYPENDEFQAYIQECYDIEKEFLEINDRIGAIEDDFTGLMKGGDLDMMIKIPYKNKGLVIAGNILCVAGILLAVSSAAYTVYEVYEYYHQDYNPIPRIIVNESSDEKGRATYTYYECTLCNRAAQGFANDTLGSYGDMNGDVGKRWLALYTTKDKAAGDAITADIIAQKGKNEMPLDKNTGTKLFGRTDTVNLVSEEYGYNDTIGGLYIFCGTESSSAADEGKTAETTDTQDTASKANADNAQTPQNTGSVVGTGIMAISCVSSAAVGALVCWIVLRKKRKGSAE